MTALSPLALNDGKDVFTSGASRIAYRRLPGLWLALGGPRGPAGEVTETMRAFARRAREEGVGFGLAPVEAGDDVVRSLRGDGLRVLPVGDVARVPVGGFHLRGNSRRTLRQSRDALLRDGWRFCLHEPPHPTSLLDALNAVSQAWSQSKRVRENTFSTGWFDRGYLERCPLAVARDDRGVPAGFVSLFGDLSGEVAGDLMRYDPASRHGVMDFLFVSLIEALREGGGRALNLGLAPLTGSAVDRAAGWQGWVMRRLARRRSWYDCQGLRRFKHKFGPAWSPAYLVYSSPAALPWIFLGMTQPVPRLPLWRRPRRPDAVLPVPRPSF